MAFHTDASPNGQTQTTPGEQDAERATGGRWKNLGLIKRLCGATASEDGVEAVPVVVAIVAHLCEPGKCLFLGWLAVRPTIAMPPFCLPATVLRITNIPPSGRHPESLPIGRLSLCEAPTPGTQRRPGRPPRWGGTGRQYARSLLSTSRLTRVCITSTMGVEIVTHNDPMADAPRSHPRGVAFPGARSSAPLSAL